MINQAADLQDAQDLTVADPRDAAAGSPRVVDLVEPVA